MNGDSLPIPRLADTHCHIQGHAFAEDGELVLARALDTLAFVVIVGDTPDSSAKAVEVCRDRVHAAVGVHPYHAALVDEDALTTLESLALQPGVVAMGEMGLDYSKYSEAPPDVQERAMLAQFALAERLGLPVIIHLRDAFDHWDQVMERHGPPRTGGIMHCFSGDGDFARRCVAWGLHISFAGNVTYPKADHLREAAAVVPEDRLLLETDSPYLAPQAVRGRRCEPAYILHTAECVARVRGVEIDALALQTTRNARRLFNLTPTGTD